MVIQAFGALCWPSSLHSDYYSGSASSTTPSLTCLPSWSCVSLFVVATLKNAPHFSGLSPSRARFRARTLCASLGGEGTTSTSACCSGIGIDDLFIMSAEWHRTNPDHSPARRIADTLSEAAVAITITSLTDIVSRGIFLPLCYRVSFQSATRRMEKH